MNESEEETKDYQLGFVDGYHTFGNTYAKDRHTALHAIVKFRAALEICNVPISVIPKEYVRGFIDGWNTNKNLCIKKA